MSKRYRTIVQYPRAIGYTQRRYSGYKQRNSGYKRWTGKTTRFGLSRRGQYLFKRRVSKVIERLAEAKYNDAWFDFDFGFTLDTSIYTSGQMIDFVGDIPQNVFATTRIGDRITLTSLQVKIIVSPWQQGVGLIATSVMPAFFLRCIIFSWRDSELPETGDIIELTGDDNVFFDMRTINSPLKHSKRIQRKIWYDKTTCHYTASTSTAATSQNPADQIEIFIPIKQYRQVYYSPADLGVTNRLCMLLLSNVCPTEEIDGKIQIGRAHV